MAFYFRLTYAMWGRYQILIHVLLYLDPVAEEVHWQEMPVVVHELSQLPPFNNKHIGSSVDGESKARKNHSLVKLRLTFTPNGKR